MMELMNRIRSGLVYERDVDLFLELYEQIEGRIICAHGNVAVWPIQGTDAPLQASGSEMDPRY
jgi:NADH:ubiquinone oxidoreductase subunit F (NADH-binding)